MKKIPYILGITSIAILGGANAAMALITCPPGSHTFSGGTQASGYDMCIPDVTSSGPVSGSTDSPGSTGSADQSGTGFAPSTKGTIIPSGDTSQTQAEGIALDSQVSAEVNRLYGTSIYAQAKKLYDDSVTVNSADFNSVVQQVQNLDPDTADALKRAYNIRAIQRLNDVWNGIIALEESYAQQLREPQINPILSGPTGVTPTPVTPTPINPTSISPTPISPTSINPTTISPTSINPTSISPTVINPTLVTATEKALVTTVDKKLADQLSGQILLQVENKGEAWYVNPTDQQKYYLGRPADAFELMRKLGLGITNADLAKIPTSDDSTTKWDSKLVNRLKGKILLQVESKGEAWYINPKDGKRYYLGSPSDAFAVMKKLGLGITNTNLRKIGVGDL